MGLLSRFLNVIRGNANSALDNIEDPAKVAAVIVQDYAAEIAKAEGAIAEYLAQVNRKKMRIVGLTKELEKTSEYCRLALEQNKEDTAKKFATKIQNLRESITAEQAVVDANNERCENMKSRLKEMQQERDKAQNRVAEMKVNTSINKSLESANKVLSSGGTATSELDRLYEKSTSQTLTQDAIAELRGKSQEEKDMDEFKKSVTSKSVDSILDEMRKK